MGTADSSAGGTGSSAGGVGKGASSGNCSSGSPISRSPGAFVLGRQPSGSAGAGKDLTSLLVSLGDEAASHSGALLRMLMPLAERGINLSKIESRPSKRRPWDYYFFLDVTGHYEDPAMREAIAELRRFCPMVKWLGSYPQVG